jgi:DNA-binding transcriptional regulator YiaG
MSTSKNRSPFFERVKSALEDALRHAQGELELKTYVLTAPEKPPVMSGAAIISLRKRLKMTEPEFSLLVNVPVRTVQLWEADKRKPSGAAARLLQVYSNHPDVVETLTNGRNGMPPRTAATRVRKKA